MPDPAAAMLFKAGALALASLVAIAILALAWRLVFGPEQPRTTNRGAVQPYTTKRRRGGPGLCVRTDDWRYLVEAGLVDWPHPDDCEDK